MTDDTALLPEDSDNMFAKMKNLHQVAGYISCINFSDKHPDHALHVLKEFIEWNTRANPTTPERAESCIDLIAVLLESGAIATKAEGMRLLRGGGLSLSVGKKRSVPITESALQSPARPVVKPLVWREILNSYGKPFLFADGVAGEFRICEISNGKFRLHIGNKQKFYNTEDEAKAAAEAHWQAKIGECLG